VTCNVGNIFIEKLVHPPDVLDPHDLQCRLEEAGESSQAMRHTRHELDRIAMRSQSRPSHVVVKERVVVEKAVAFRSAR
jgi:hypothetical protein